MPPPESNSVKPSGSGRADREARVGQVFQELITESDRGCILVGASVLDHFLEERLRTALVSNSHAVKHAVSPLFEPMRPLSSFSAKIKLAYGLGLIPQYCFTDLEKIRRIRNVAAHQYSAMSFESREIIEITQTLEAADRAVQSFGDMKIDTDPQPSAARPQTKFSKERMRFVLTVSYIAGILS